MVHRKLLWLRRDHVTNTCTCHFESACFLGRLYDTIGVGMERQVFLTYTPHLSLHVSSSNWRKAKGSLLGDSLRRVLDFIPLKVTQPVRIQNQKASLIIAATGANQMRSQQRCTP